MQPYRHDDEERTDYNNHTQGYEEIEYSFKKMLIHQSKLLYTFSSSAQIIFCSNLVSITLRAFTPISFILPLFSTKYFIASYRAFSLCEGMITPFTSLVIISLQPLISVTIAGNPIAPASSTVFGNPSLYEGNTNVSEAA